MYFSRIDAHCGSIRFSKSLEVFPNSIFGGDGCEFGTPVFFKSFEKKIASK